MLETVRTYSRISRARVALFDFDGTLSLVRSGWMQLMVSMFVDELQPLTKGEDQNLLESHVRDIVLQLTGKETIHQMSALADEVRMRGGAAKPAAKYKEMFLDRLSKIVEARRSGLRTGELKPDDLIVPGGRAALGLLRDEGLTLYLASGTDEESVQEEAKLLDITKYFADRIFGARDDGNGFTKAALVKQLVTQGGYRPSELVGFGDGYVEIHEVSNAGGFAVGLATDEPQCRRIDEGKRRHLVAAGAHVVLPNFDSPSEWVSLLFAGAECVDASPSKQ